MKHMLVDFVRFQDVYPQLGMLVVSVLKSGVIILMAAAVALLLQTRSARARNWVWRCALMGLFVLLLWQIVPLGIKPGALAWHAAPAADAEKSSPVTGMAGINMGGTSQAGYISPVNRNEHAFVSCLTVMERGAGWVWISGAGFFILWKLLRSRSGMLWLRQYSKRIEWDQDGPKRASGSVFFPELDLRIHRLLETPLLAGLFHPAIYLPESARAWPAQKRRNVLRHEMAHHSRNDLWWQFAGAGLCCLWWWNPLAWTAYARMKAEAEQAADDLVVLESGAGEAYARLLVEMAAGCGQTRVVGISMLGGSLLEHRIRAILQANPFRNTIGGLGAGLLACFSVLVVLCLGTGVVLGEVDLTNSYGEIIHYQADPANNQLAQGDFNKTGGKLDEWTGSLAAVSVTEHGIVRLKAEQIPAVIETVLKVPPDWKWLTVSARIRLAPGTKLAEGQEAVVSFIPEDGSGKSTGAVMAIRESNREGYTNWIGPIRTIPLAPGTASLKIQMRLTEGPGQLECSGVDVVPTRAEDELDHRLVDKFYEAVKAGNTKIVSAMLSEEPRLVEARKGSADDGTPLIFCAWLEQPEVAQVLVDHGANLKAMDYGAWRSTALMWCGWWGSPKTAAVLLKAGADLNARSIHDVTPLSAAQGGKGGNKASKATPAMFDETIALFSK